MDLTKVINLTKITYTLFGIVFLISGLAINFLQFVIYIFLRPINKHLFRKCNYYLTYALCSQIVFVEQYWANVKVTVHTKKKDFEYFGKESALLMMNHTYEVDWMLGWVFCEVSGILGDVKTFAKKSLQYIPTVGYSWKFGGSIFVERDWKKDQEMFEKKIQNIVTYRDNVWLLVAAEGTRFTPEKHEAAKEFAKSNGLPELRYHLVPRTRGFTTALPILRQKMRVLYDIELIVKPGGVRPTLTNILLGKSINCDIYVTRIPMEDLPEDKDDLATWLYSLYKTKDDIFHGHVTGDWSAVPEVKEYASFVLPRRIFPILNFSFWTVCVLHLLGGFILRLIVTGTPWSLGMVAGIIGSFVFVVGKLFEETEMSKASSYGNSKKTC